MARACVCPQAIAVAIFRVRDGGSVWLRDSYPSDLYSKPQKCVSCVSVVPCIYTSRPSCIGSGSIHLAMLLCTPPPPHSPHPCIVPRAGGGGLSRADSPPRKMWQASASHEKPPRIPSKHPEARCGSWCIVLRREGAPSFGHSAPWAGGHRRILWGGPPTSSSTLVRAVGGEKSERGTVGGPSFVFFALLLDLGCCPRAHFELDGLFESGKKKEVRRGVFRAFQKLGKREGKGLPQLSPRERAELNAAAGQEAADRPT